ncbi:MAG: oxidoreductase, partial [Myxococcota bacterium]
PYTETVDGFERTFGVCYLGHAALVVALLDRLRAAAPARVVLVSSDNHRWPRRFRLDQVPTPRAAYSELTAYGHTKRCLVLLARALTDRFGGEGITANALHPGDLIATGIDRDSALLRWVMRLARPFTRSPAQAAATSVHLATDPALEGIGGRYFVDRVEVAPAPGALDPVVAAALWARTEGWLAGQPVERSPTGR